MSEYAQSSRSSGQERRASGGRRSGGLADSLNARPAVQRTAQLKSALNGGAVAQLNGDGEKKGLLSDFVSKYLYGRHQYKFENFVSKRKEGETDEELKRRIYEDLVKYPAPLALRKSSEEGQNTPMMGGLINTMANPLDFSVHNITKFPHIFHNYFGGQGGSVSQQAIVDAEGGKVITSGEGYGTFPRLNELAGKYGFSAMHYKRRMRFDPEFAAQHYAELQKAVEKHSFTD